MKQIAQNYKSGEIFLLEVPVPACKSGGVLVRTDYSLISMGTEAMKIHESKLSLIGKDLSEYSRDTVAMFYKDAVSAKYDIPLLQKRAA